MHGIKEMNFFSFSLLLGNQRFRAIVNFAYLVPGTKGPLLDFDFPFFSYKMGPSFMPPIPQCAQRSRHAQLRKSQIGLSSIFFHIFMS